MHRTAHAQGHTSAKSCFTHNLCKYLLMKCIFTETHFTLTNMLSPACNLINIWSIPWTTETTWPSWPAVQNLCLPAMTAWLHLFGKPFGNSQRRSRALRFLTWKSKVTKHCPITLAKMCTQNGLAMNTAKVLNVGGMESQESRHVALTFFRWRKSVNGLLISADLRDNGRIVHLDACPSFDPSRSNEN